MEVLVMAGKLLRIISPDKIKNRDAEYYKQALDLNQGYSDFGTVSKFCYFADEKSFDASYF